MNLKKIIGFKKTITVSKYFEIIHPKYSILRLIPDTSIRNYNSESIARIISTMYTTTLDRIEFKNLKMIYRLPYKASFFIDISKQSICFYIIVPNEFEKLICEKISSTWPKATIKKTDSVNLFSKNALEYELVYKNKDALSLKVDRKSNEPLSSILNVLDIMNGDDRLGIYYNFLPADPIVQRNKYINDMKSIKQNGSYSRNRYSAGYIAKVCIDKIMENLILGYKKLGDFLCGSGESLIDEIAISKVSSEKSKRFHYSTLSKGSKSILDSQIIILSDSKDRLRKKNNAIGAAESFKVISQDNSFNYRQVKTNIYYTEYKVKGVEINKVSTAEATNFIQLPGRNILSEYKNIEKVDVLESPIPDELKNGDMCIGDTTYKGKVQKAYLSTDKEFKNLTLCLIGPTRSGKTTLISNLVKNSIYSNECSIIFDFCGNCDLSNDVSQCISQNKILGIDCSDFNKLQGIGYNEIQPINNSVFEVYRCAKTKTNQLMTFVNSINSEDSDLRARMERYLEAAALVTFINNGSIKNVFDILQDHVKRHNYIKNIPDAQKENLEKYVITLEELDEKSKVKDSLGKVIGTKISNVQGILNRVSKMQQNAYMELMLKKDCTDNINLTHEIQKSQLICIRMPELMFSTEQEKDIYCTYWLTKIWGALQVRKWLIPNYNRRTKVNIVFDELYQVPRCQQFLKSKLSQIAKFNCKPIISCHYLGQISIIRNELKAANASYMLISGSDKDNFKELKDELYPYELNDLLNLKRYNSLNLIKYPGGWAKFITALPGPCNKSK
jgi:hypothetical protein